MAAERIDLDWSRIEVQSISGGCATYPAATGFGPRRLRDFEFVWILDGGADWSGGGAEVSLAPGDCLLCRPGERDAFRWHPQRPTRHGFIHFACTGAGLPPVSTWPRVRTAIDDGILLPLFEHLLHLLPAGDQIDLQLAAGALIQALAAFVSGRTARRAEVEWALASGPVRAALGILDDYWRERGRLEPLPLAQLARAVGVSRQHLVRAFGRELGHPPQEAVRRLRLARAADLLARTDLAVAEVADACGFDDPFHFSRAFRRLHGVAPRTFRERLARGESHGSVAPVAVRRVMASLGW